MQPTTQRPPLPDLSCLTPRTRQIRLLARWQLALSDPIRFQRWFVWTLDQHDQQRPCKPFPWERPHLQAITRLWQANRMLSICKSRQMVMTWWGASICLWDALHSGKFILQQSKRLEDAVGDEHAGDGPLGRTKFILEHIPGKRILGLVEGRDYVKQSAHISFPKLNSSIWAIPQGANIIRQRTASGILSDESQFQEEFADAYTAARPCIRGGGWFVSLSTANPGAANDLHADKLGDR